MLALRKKIKERTITNTVLHVGGVPKNLSLEEAHEYLY